MFIQQVVVSPEMMYAFDRVLESTPKYDKIGNTNFHAPSVELLELVGLVKITKNEFDENVIEVKSSAEKYFMAQKFSEMVPADVWERDIAPTHGLDPAPRTVWAYMVRRAHHSIAGREEFKAMVDAYLENPFSNAPWRVTKAA